MTCNVQICALPVLLAFDKANKITSIEKTQKHKTIYMNNTNRQKTAKLRGKTGPSFPTTLLKKRRVWRPNSSRGPKLFLLFENATEGQLRHHLSRKEGGGGASAKRIFSMGWKKRTEPFGEATLVCCGMRSINHESLMSAS